jgi:hypothetical protein
MMAFAVAAVSASVLANTASAADVELAGVSPAAAPAAAATAAVAGAATPVTNLAATAAATVAGSGRPIRRVRSSVAATTTEGGQPTRPIRSAARDATPRPTPPVVRSAVSRTRTAIEATSDAAASAANATPRSAASAADSTSGAATSAADSTSGAAASAADSTLRTATTTIDSTLYTATRTTDSLVGFVAGLGAWVPPAAAPLIAAAKRSPGARVAATTQAGRTARPASSFGPWRSGDGPTAHGGVAAARMTPARPSIGAVASAPLFPAADQPRRQAAGASPTLPQPAPSHSGASVAGAIGPGSAGATAALLLAIFLLVAPAIRRHLVAPPTHRWPAAPVFLLDRPG